MNFYDLMDALTLGIWFIMFALWLGLTVTAIRVWWPLIKDMWK